MLFHHYCVNCSIICLINVYTQKAGPMEMGTPKKIVNMIRKMYDTVKVCVKSMNSKSEFFKSYVGVKQGEPLSPLLFIIFINDMANDLLSNGISTFNINHFQMFMLLVAHCTICRHFGRTTNTYG